MRIWIMRHGEACFNAKTDNQRMLTEKGKEMAFKQGRWLAKRILNQNVSVDKIIVSPYVRTQQTAERLILGMQAVSSMQSFAKFPQRFETWSGITPSGQVENVVNYLHFLREDGAKNIVMISHLPLVYDLVQNLTNYQQSVHFYPAVIAELEYDVDSGKLILAEYP